MKKNIYESFSDKDLIKRRNLLRGVTIGFSIIYIILLAAVIYLFATKGFGKSSIAILVPLLMLPVTFLPIMINIGQMNKEIKLRNI